MSENTQDTRGEIIPEETETQTPPKRSPFPTTLFPPAGQTTQAEDSNIQAEGLPMPESDGASAPPTVYGVGISPDVAEDALDWHVDTASFHPEIAPENQYDDASTAELGASTMEVAEARKKKLKNIVLGVVLVLGIGWYVNKTYINNPKPAEPTPSQQTQAVNTGSTNSGTTNSGATSTGETFAMADTPLALLYGSGSGTGALQFNGTVMAQIKSDDGSLGLIFNTRTKYAKLDGDTKASLMFKGLKFISSYPSFFGGTSTRILAMGKAFYSETLGSGFFQIDNIVAPDSVKKTFQKTIDTYTAHWAQYQTSSLNPKTTLNAFANIASAIKSKDDFDNLFSTKPFGASGVTATGGMITGNVVDGITSTSTGSISNTGSTSTGTLSDSGSTASGITLYLNPVSSLKDKVTAGLDPLVASILFAPETKTTIYLEKDTGIIKITIEFPSSLYFKDSKNTGTGTLTIDGVITPAETGVENEPNDSRMWGSEYIDSLSNSSTFEPINTTATGTVVSTGNVSSGTTTTQTGATKTGPQKYSDIYHSGATVPLLPKGKNESDGVNAD